MTIEQVTGPVDGTLRSLSEQEFEARYDAGRFTCTILSSRLRYVVEHICTDLLHRAFSPIISFAHDFCGGIVGPPDQDYPLTAVNKGNVIFLGTLSAGVRNSVEEYGLERLRQGDLLICNDPLRVGNHVNDMCFARPVFHEGQIACFVVIRAHQLDMGGTVPGGFALKKKNVYENGLVLGPQLLFRGDDPVRETFSTILDNVRFGEMLLPDLRTIHRCCQLGERLILESIERYGIDALRGAMRYACDASADAMRGAVAALDDGEWEGEAVLDADAIDADEEYRVHVKVIKRGTRLEVDLSGSSRQARTCVNAGALDAQTAVAIGLKLLVDPTTPFTSGLYRDIDVVVPPGTVTSALPPDGAIMFYWEVQNALVHAIFAAMQEPLGARAVAADHGTTSGHSGFGVGADGRPWQSISECGGEFGAWGATAAGDGESHSCIFLLNMIAVSSEEIEHRSPVIIVGREYVPDTGGPGTHRGGASIQKESLWLRDGEHYLVPLRLKYPSGIGVHGGRAGAQGGAWWFEADAMGNDPAQGLESLTVPGLRDFEGATPMAGRVDPETGAPDPDGEFAYFSRKDVWPEPGGSMLRVVTNGGGGWGDPLQRDVEAVKRDVRDGYVTIDGARDHYGVVVTGDPHHDPEGLQVDDAATAARRAARA